MSLGLLLGACANSERLGGAFGTARAAPTPQAQPLPEPLPAPPVTSAPIQSAPLAPPPGAAQPPQPQPDPLFQQPPQPQAPATPPPAPRQIEQPPVLGGGGGQIPTLGGQQQARAPVSGRDGLLGGWTAREANGGSCRITLSSTPALDLSRASSAGCGNRDLQGVTAWDFRDGEVFIYKPGGAVSARLRVSDGSSMIGILTRSGATLSMNR